MTMLSVIQTFCERTGLPSPSFVAGASNAQVTQLQALLNECLEDICDRWSWQGLVKEATFTTVAQEDQGAVTTLAPSGFLSVLNETIYNRTLRLPVYGPLAASKWQALKALPNSGPFYKYRIRGGRLLFNPSATAGHLCAFEYKSSFAVIAADGTEKSYATADDDTFVFEERLLQAALRWKWRSEKGLDYAEEMRRFEEMAADMAGRDATKPTISMSTGSSEFRPGIFVPAGNWMQS